MCTDPSGGSKQPRALTDTSIKSVSLQESDIWNQHGSQGRTETPCQETRRMKRTPGRRPAAVLFWKAERDENSWFIYWSWKISPISHIYIFVSFIARSLYTVHVVCMHSTYTAWLVIAPPAAHRVNSFPRAHESVEWRWNAAWFLAERWRTDSMLSKHVQTRE